MGMETSTVERARATRCWGQAVLFVGAAVAALAADQLSKVAVRAALEPGQRYPDGWPVRLVNVDNSGAAFGILQNMTAFLVVTSLIGIGVILYYAFFPPAQHAVVRVALGMVLGGALGNFVDRVRTGEVTDFIDFPHYPAFNLADSSIVVGLLLLAATAALSEQQRGQPSRERGDP